MTDVLETAAAVISELGGINPTAKLTGRSSHNVWNWKAGGKFPATTFFVFRAALYERGKTAPLSLWSMEPAEGSA